MKKHFSLLLLALLCAMGIHAQTLLAGDMNEDGNLSISDVTTLVEMVAGKMPVRQISSTVADNHAIEGTWTSTQKSVTFNSDGTTNYMSSDESCTYVFQPLQGSVVFFRGGTYAGFVLAVWVSDNMLILYNPSNSSTDVLYKGSRVSAITLSRTTISGKPGDTVVLTATLSDNAAIRDLTWTSSKTSVATVDANGEVKLVAEGTATITCAAQDGSGVTAMCTVTVTTGPQVTNYASWTSTNNSHNSTSSNTYTIPYTSGSTLSFDWYVSSEEDYDWLIVTIDGAEVLKKSGEESGTYTKHFTSSGTVTMMVKYTKDGSESDNDDKGEVYNIKLTGSTDGGTSGTPNTINGHEYVDLGLPSGTKWATCNVGASSPEDYGDYFAWGEITGYNSGKTTFNWSTYKYCNGSQNTMTKYCMDSSYGTMDNKTELDLSDDAARANWGGSWRMPSLEQIKELCDRNNCTWTLTTLNGKYGYRVASVRNGNNIFFPAAGYFYGGTLYDDSVGVIGGAYWIRSLSTDFSCNAYYLGFTPTNVSDFSDNRRYGLSVRAVSE